MSNNEIIKTIKDNMCGEGCRWEGNERGEFCQIKDGVLCPYYKSGLKIFYFGVSHGEQEVKEVYKDKLYEIFSLLYYDKRRTKK